MIWTASSSFVPSSYFAFTVIDGAFSPVPAVDGANEVAVNAANADIRLSTLSLSTASIVSVR